MSNWQYAQVVPTVAWRSALTLPRTLLLRKTEAGYRLFSEPVRELQSLRGKSHELPAARLEGSLDLTVQLGFSPTLCELELEFVLPASGSFGVELSNSKSERYRVGFDASQNRFFSDRTKSGDASFHPDFAKQPSTAPRISTEKAVKMHLVFDVASVELFADGGATVMTEVFFPGEDFNCLKLFSEGGTTSLIGGKVYELRGIWR
jgi:fructan beta-fructosidase